MCIKKLGSRFKKPYRLLMVTGMTISLLGISYGYWSDEKVIEATVITPKIVLESDKPMQSLRTLSEHKDIEICKADDEGNTLLHEHEACCEDERILTITVDKVEGEESDIPIKYADCEVYYIDDINKPEEKISLDDLNPAVYSVQDKSTEEGKYEIEIKLSTFALKKLLNENPEDYQMGDGELKVKLNFKQEVEDGEAGWEYPVEKTFSVGFISPLEQKEDIKKISLVRPQVPDAAANTGENTNTNGSVKGDNVPPTDVSNGDNGVPQTSEGVQQGDLQANGGSQEGSSPQVSGTEKAESPSQVSDTAQDGSSSQVSESPQDGGSSQESGGSQDGDTSQADSSSQGSDTEQTSGAHEDSSTSQGV